MAAAPAITVLMTTYNREQLVGYAIESILSQTCTDFEFVIVDDGSTDNSREVLERYAAVDRRIRLFFIEHFGRVRALNYGLRAARAPLIAIMDSDDASYPRRLEIEYEFMERNRDIAVVGGSAVIMHNGVQRGYYFMPHRYRMIYESFFRTLKHIVNSSVMMRKDAILKVGGYRPSFSRAEDLDLWLSLLVNGYRLASIPNILVNYHHYFTNLSRDNWYIDFLSHTLAYVSYYLRKDGMADCIQEDTILSSDIVKKIPYKYKKLYEDILFHNILAKVKKMSNYKKLMYREVTIYDIIILYGKLFFSIPIFVFKTIVRDILYFIMRDKKNNPNRTMMKANVH